MNALERANERIARGTRDAALFIYAPWGNETLANVAGTTATARGTDPASFSTGAAYLQPEPLMPQAPGAPIAGGAAGGTGGGSVIAGTWFPNIPTPGAVGREVNDVINGVTGQLTGQKGRDVLRDSGFILLAIVIVALGLYAIVK